MKSKLCSIILIVILILTVFCSCKKTEPSETETTTVHSQTETTEDTADETTTQKIKKESEVSADYSANANGYTDFIKYIVDDSEYSTKILFTAEGEVTDFRLLSLLVTDVDDNGRMTFDTDTLYELDTLEENKPLEVTLSFYGDTPAYGISYKDAGGNTKNFTVTLSGEDGSVILTEF